MSLAIAIDQIQRPTWWVPCVRNNQSADRIAAGVEMRRRILDVLSKADHPLRIGEIYNEVAFHTQGMCRDHLFALYDQGKVKRQTSSNGGRCYLWSIAP